MPNCHFLDLKDNQVVLFADIVGFSNIVRAAENVEWADPKEQRLQIKLDRIYKIVTSCEFSKEHQKKAGIKFLWVSDSIIISCDAENINNLLAALTTLTNTLYSAGFAICGAISVGKLYHEENVWGASLVDAVELERNTHKPMIVISTENFDKLNIEESYKKFFLAGGKKCIYYDFFAAFFAARIAEGKNLSSYLGVYISLIADNYREAKKRKHRRKWRWLSGELIRAIKTNREYIDEWLQRRETFSSITGKRISSVDEYLSYLQF